jgi:hypothetical protein
MCGQKNYLSLKNLQNFCEKKTFKKVHSIFFIKKSSHWDVHPKIIIIIIIIIKICGIVEGVTLMIDLPITIYLFLKHCAFPKIEA